LRVGLAVMHVILAFTDGRALAAQFRIKVSRFIVKTIMFPWLLVYCVCVGKIPMGDGRC
jgi:hypothetical protein